MELEISKETKNALAESEEIEFSIKQGDKTPSKDEVKVALCKKLNLSPEGTIVVEINQAFGAKECTGVARSYKDAAAMKKHEHEHFFMREEKKAKKKAGGAAPAAEKKAETETEAETAEAKQ